MKLLQLVLIALLVAGAADAKPKRSEATRHSFQRAHPCPSTGKKTGACPGYIKDHVRALCDGGRDVPSNMQWQTTSAAKAKDRSECRTKHH